jgi:hypothetical protein
MENKRIEVGSIVLIKGLGIARVTSRLDSVCEGSKIVMAKLISSKFKNSVISTLEFYLERVEPEDEDLIRRLEEIGII